MSSAVKDMYLISSNDRFTNSICQKLPKCLLLFSANQNTSATFGWCAECGGLINESSLLTPRNLCMQYIIHLESLRTEDNFEEIWHSREFRTHWEFTSSSCIFSWSYSVTWSNSSINFQEHLYELSWHSQSWHLEKSPDCRWNNPTGINGDKAHNQHQFNQINSDNLQVSHWEFTCPNITVQHAPYIRFCPR